MSTLLRFGSAVFLLAIPGCLLHAQSVTSAHSGTVHYFEGAVSIDGTAIEAQRGKFSQLKDNSVLTTGQGRAEILLTPGVFLRVGENSSVRMLDSRLLSTRVEFLSGTALIESDDPEVSVKDPAVTILYKDYQIQAIKFGLFELSSEPSRMKVFKGQADVTGEGNHVTVKEGRMLLFSAALTTEKFDPKEADDLYLWARDRGAYISAANITSARTVASNGYNSLGGYPGTFRGSWYYNTFLDMYTYMPFGGAYWSPFGYGLFSPYSIYAFYNPSNYYWMGGGGTRNGGSAGQPVNSPQQISRFGVAANHPTLSTPIRGSVGGGVSTLRGGFDRSGGQQGVDTNPGFNASSRSVDIGASRGGFNGGSAGAGSFSTPAASSGGGHASTGGAVSAPRGR